MIEQVNDDLELGANIYRYINQDTTVEKYEYGSFIS